MHGSMSRKRLGVSGEWSILEPVLFNFSVSDTDDGIDCTLSKFTDDSELNVPVDIAEGADTARGTLINSHEINEIHISRLQGFALNNLSYVYEMGEEFLEWFC